MIWQKKQRLRDKIRQRLARMTVSERAEASQQIRELLFASPIWQKAKIIFCFAPMPGEPDWIGSWEIGDKVLVFPRIVSNRLAFHRIHVASDLLPGPFGGLQPASGEEVHKGDLILVPGLAFDCVGYRLGRGKGFYDRFLAGQKAFKLGVCFSSQLVEEVPHEAHDALVDAIITNTGIFEKKPNRE